MTEKQFFSRLARVTRKWHLVAGLGWIRYGRRDSHVSACPVSSLQNMDACMYLEVADTLQLSESFARRVALAADDKPGHDPELRAKLLKACGLESA